ncbi:MAG: hypothetical protein ACYTGB_00355 [Planctomycetota bacterium]
MKRTLWLPVSILLLSTAAARCAELRLNPTRDARLFGHASETGMNGGQCTRLRTRGLSTNQPEISLMDFDRKAIMSFITKNRGKAVTAKLVLTVREVGQAEKVKVELAAFKAAVDWKEGTKNQAAAERGESTYLEAQSGVAPWADLNGKKKANFKELLLSGPAAAVINSASLEVKPAMSDTKVTLTLDANVLGTLVGVQGCRGLALFNRSGKATADFYSREQHQHKPELVLTAP